MNWTSTKEQGLLKSLIYITLIPVCNRHLRILEIFMWDIWVFNCTYNYISNLFLYMKNSIYIILKYKDLIALYK